MNVKFLSTQSSLHNIICIILCLQSMKIEKDNACDRVDTCEEACKSANIRAQKAEDEVRADESAIKVLKWMMS